MTTGRWWQVRSGRVRARVAVAAVLVAVGLTATGCGITPVITPLDPSLDAYPITDNRPDTYAVVVHDDAVVASASPDNTAGNTRVVFWRRDEARTADQEVCATWRSSTFDFRQEGVVLRLRFDEGDGRGILITKNVWGGAFWTINVSTFRTTDAPSITLLRAFDLSNALGRGDRLAPLPWRICARAVGATVSFVVWPLGQPRPAWDDADHTGRLPAPADLMAPGVGGWYVGHLQPGQAVVYDDLYAGEPTAAGD